MMLNDQTTFYDVLDLKPDATPDEIREAYLRTKSAYSKDSVALYSLISPEETKEMLRRVEEAYEVLSNPEKRKEYDAYYGFLSLDGDFVEQVRPSKKIISIDRVPPMESNHSEEDLLVAPSTDFPARAKAAPAAPLAPVAKAPARAVAPIHIPSAPAPAREQAYPPPISPHSNFAPKGAGPNYASDSTLEQEILQQTEWKGLFLRRVREACRLSIEEMAAITKITKTYLLAIEDENFAKLPAAVYVRGFVTQVAKVLKLPHDKVSAAYMARFNEFRAKTT
jgi:hypothetical protein